MIGLVFDSKEDADKWRIAHVFLESAPLEIQGWFLNYFGSGIPYPNDTNTSDFTTVQLLSEGEYSYEGGTLEGYLVRIYENMYHSLINEGLWEDVCNLLSHPFIIIDCDHLKPTNE